MTTPAFADAVGLRASGFDLYAIDRQFFRLIQTDRAGNGASLIIRGFTMSSVVN
jgi:hypothetical protein